MAKRFPISLPGVLLLVGGALLLAAGCSSLQSNTAPAAWKDPATVATFGEDVLTLDDFEDQYARSVGGREQAADDSLAAYQDFLERYVNFRLKVLEAAQSGYREDPKIQDEINSYRGSFARPYLLDRAVIEPLVRTLYERSQEMVDASHLLLRIRPDASPEDSLATYMKIAALRDSVLQGVDFGELAFRHSEDPSAQMPDRFQGYQGRLRFFSAGRMVEPFENQAYQTPVGEVSPIFRTRFGYHLLYVHDRQSAVPDIRISHLMIRPTGATPEDSAQVASQMEAFKAQLAAGASFEELARDNSVDKQSAQKDGDLGFLRYDNYQILEAFRQAAFSLENPGDISDVVISPYGYHLIKLTDRKTTGTYEEQYEALKKTATDMPRAQEAEKRLSDRLLAQYGATVDTAVVANIVASTTMDSVLHVLGGVLPDSVRQQRFATLGDTAFTIADLSDFLQNNSVPRSQTKEGLIENTLDTYMHDQAINYEAAALESRDEEFGRVIQEFRDGLVLFKLMEDSVWTAAAQDSAGLKAYFDAHRDAYVFPERTRIVEIYSPSDSLLRVAHDRLANGLMPATLLDDVEQDTTGLFSTDTLLVPGPTNSVYDQALALGEGEYTDLIPHRYGQVVLIHDGMEPPRPKTFDEARTEAINDYQNVLEDRLLKRLRRVYRARTFPERLTRAFTQPPGDTTTTATSTQ